MSKESKILVVDLEATCWANSIMPGGERQNIHSMETIEFGCALATRAGDLLDSQSFLVRPTYHPQLTEFCTNLTGITQSMVNAVPTFPEAVKVLDEWLGEPSKGFIWCSWGSYDLKQIMADSAKHGAAPRFLEFRHLNLRKIWRRTTGQKKKNSLMGALDYHGLSFEGRHHRGIDDARNIVRLLPYVDWQLESEISVPGVGRSEKTKQKTKSIAERELLEGLTPHTAHADALASPTRGELEPLEKLKGSVKRYERPTDPVWDEWFDSEGCSEDFASERERRDDGKKGSAKDKRDV